MEILEYLQIVKKYTTMIVLLCVFATSSTFLLTFLVTEVYEASALLLVKPYENISIADKKGNDKEILNFPVGGGISKAELVTNTYIEIIRSRAIAEKVVRLLQWEVEKPEAPAETPYEKLKSYFKKTLKEFVFTIKQIAKYGRVLKPPSPFEKAVERFQNNISLEAIKDTYEFEIKFAAEDSQEAAAAANAAARLFIEYMAEMNLHTTKQPLEYLEQRVQESTKELAEARRALREFKAKNQTISFKDETTEEIKLISDLEKELEKTDVRLAGYLQQLMPANPKVQSVQAEKERLLSALTQRKNKINELPDKERQLNTLIANVNSAEEIYRLISKEYEATRIRAGNYLREELELVSPAVPPLYPSKPIRFKYVSAALALAILVGIGLPFFFVYMNTTLQKIEDVERVLQLRVLATLPQMGIISNPKH